jgi:dihydrofolate reductase
MSGKVVVNRSMSLDGFIAGPDDTMDWVFDFVAPDEFPEIAAATGAMLIGRRTYEVGKRMEAEDSSAGGVTGSPPGLRARRPLCVPVPVRAACVLVLLTRSKFWARGPREMARSPAVGESGRRERFHNVLWTGSHRGPER